MISAFLSLDQSAEYLNLSRRTIERLTRSGAIPVHRFGKAVRIKRSELDAFAEATAVNPDAYRV